MNQASRALIFCIVVMCCLFVPLWVIRPPRAVAPSYIDLDWVLRYLIPVVAGLYAGFALKTRQSAIYACLATSAAVSILVAVRWWQVASFDGFVGKVTGVLIVYFVVIFGIMAAGLSVALVVRGRWKRIWGHERGVREEASLEPPAYQP